MFWKCYTSTGSGCRLCVPIVCENFPTVITCDLEVKAIQKAFPEMQGRILSKLANGDCACLFQYERKVEQAVTYFQS